MACTFLRLVQAAVSLRHRFECAIQSSFDSVGEPEPPPGVIEEPPGDIKHDAMSSIDQQSKENKSSHLVSCVTLNTTLPDSTPSESESETLTSVRTVRCRTISPSGSKPSKLIKCDNISSDISCKLKRSDSHPSESESSHDSDEVRRDWLSYSKWMLTAEDTDKTPLLPDYQRAKETGLVSSNTIGSDYSDIEFDEETLILEPNDTHYFCYSNNEKLEGKVSLDEGYIDDYLSFDYTKEGPANPLPFQKNPYKRKSLDSSSVRQAASSRHTKEIATDSGLLPRKQSCHRSSRRSRSVERRKDEEHKRKKDEDANFHVANEDILNPCGHHTRKSSNTRRNNNKRSPRPHLVQRQQCIEDRSNSDVTTDEDKIVDCSLSPIKQKNSRPSTLKPESEGTISDFNPARSSTSYRGQKHFSSSLNSQSPPRVKNEQRTGGSLDTSLSKDISYWTPDNERTSIRDITMENSDVTDHVSIKSYETTWLSGSFRKCQNERTNTHEPLVQRCTNQPYYVRHTSYEGNSLFTDDDTNSDRLRFSWRDGIRRQSSLESGELEDLLENRHQLEQDNMDSTPSDEEGARSKVRYNDVGSLEQVNEDIMEIAETRAQRGVDYEHIRVQCQALWQLRATLEEEDPEECESDNGKADTMSSSESRNRPISPEVENTTTSHTTSFESRSDNSGPGNQATEPTSSLAVVTSSAANFLTSEERRTSYRSILAQRFRHLDTTGRPAISLENSFESVETDWSSTTDLSRPELLTTSLDSTTDCPTDSTGDNHSHRLQQMKADSGYRSLEATNRSCLQSSSIVGESMEVLPESSRGRQLTTEMNESLDDSVLRSRNRRQNMISRKTSSRLAAKKRRELMRDWQHVSLDAGLALEAEANSGDEISGKRSVLAKFLRTNRTRTGGSLRIHHQRLLQRDYSIDAKSDQLFKEFSQPEAQMFSESELVRGRSRLYAPSRRHRHLEPTDSGTRTQLRKLSPQDSIEEEDSSAMWLESEQESARKLHTSYSYIAEP